MECDPFSEFEFPGQGIDSGPFRGQCRSQPTFRRRSLEQAVKEIGHVGQVGIGIVTVGIHALGRGIHGDHQV